MKIAILIKQIPKFETMQLGADGRLVRDGLELEISAFCRRAISKGVELAREHHGTCTVFTLGPPSAADALKEAIAWGADDGVHITGAGFVGSDTLATSRALAAALKKFGPFDLVLAGLNSIDADTGQVGPGVAELLQYPFLPGVKKLELIDNVVLVHCEEDDQESNRRVVLPAVISTAERLCEPCKVDRSEWSEVADALITSVGPSDLGGGPYGQEGSSTIVGEVKVHEHTRVGRVLDGVLDEQVKEAILQLENAGGFDATNNKTPHNVASPVAQMKRNILVVIEPNRVDAARELLGCANGFSAISKATVIAFDTNGTNPMELQSWGADRAILLEGDTKIAENVAASLSAWAATESPWAILLPSTTWGREVASRSAVALGAGLTGDAVELEVDVRDESDPKLIAWKPVFQGHLLAAIHATSPIQIATVRPGVLPLLTPRFPSVIALEAIELATKSRVEFVSTTRTDDIEALTRAQTVVCVGAGVLPHDYELVEELADLLGAEIAATRKVTDKGWMPRSRQIGITARSVAPRLYIAIGISGKYNHMVGAQQAGTILAINSDPTSLVFQSSDIGIIADWKDVVVALIKALRAR